MRRDLFLRTDVLPDELPILFSNKNVYLNFSERAMLNDYKDLLNEVTVPLFFYIPKNEGAENRKISLVHPVAQLQMFQYVIQFEELITAHSKKTQFSVRAPQKRNFPKLLSNKKLENEYKKIQQEYGFVERFPITRDEDFSFFYNYFSFNRYKYLKGLIESAQFRRTQYKFDYFRKLDIQNFFPSIYTHSLSWALFGSKVLGKSYSGVKEAFPNKTDRIMQEINFMETNGIVVGPEFSRMVAELLLVDIDSKLLIYMENNGIYHHSDYKIYRFVDDYYIFANNSYHISLIENELQRLLEGYNLTLNTHKAELQQKPFKISNKAISDLRNILSEFEHSKLVSVFRNLEKHVKVNINNNDITLSHVSLKSFKGTRQQWNDLFIQIELLIDEYPNEKNKIVNYFLQSIRSQINFDGEHINIFKDILEIVSNIYTLNITTKSTNYLLTINLKLQQALSKFENKQAKLEDRELTDVILKKQREANDLKENIYQHLFRVMKNNLTRMNYMYDLLVFMKSLDKKLPASFLSTIIEKFKNSYFVLCSVGYYILDDSLQSVDKRYITVRKKLTKVVTDYINNYKSWGIKNQKIILEADFFYFINDFSKYPGFETSVKKGLNALLTKEIGKVVSQNSLQKQLWKNLTDRSYFQWEGTYENFKRKIIKKNSNIGKNIRVGDY